MNAKSFTAASKQAEEWVGTVFIIGQIGKCCQQEGENGPGLRGATDNHLQFLYEDVSKHASVIEKHFDELAVISDGAINWPKDRGYAAISEIGNMSSWSSAHEAAVGMARMALALTINPEALAMPDSEESAIKERIRRERAKILAKGGTEEDSIVSLDARALAVFIEHNDWTKVRIAEYIGCNEKSLAPRRCPKLSAAIAAYRARPPMRRGYKDIEGNIEARQ